MADTQDPPNPDDQNKDDGKGTQDTKDNGNPNDDDDEAGLPDAIKAILAKNRQETRAAVAAAKAQQKEAQKIIDANKTAEQRAQEEREREKAELANARLENMRLRVGAKLGLPAQLMDRLRGDTEADMEEDAKALKALLGAAPTKQTPKGDHKKGGSGAGGLSMNDLLRAAAKGN